jgi:hypothetical protein
MPGHAGRRSRSSCTHQSILPPGHWICTADDLLRLGLHRLPIGDFPLLRGLAPVLAAYDGAAELERGLDILLTGLTTTLTGPGQARQPAKHPGN